MLILLTNVIGRPVVSGQDGAPVGKVAAAVFDGARGKLVAYRLATSRHERFVSTVDVTAYLENAVTVTNAGVAQAAEDLPVLGKVLLERTDPIGCRAVTESGKRLGRVKECTFETDGHYLVKLHVSPPFWQLTRRDLIIPRERVLRFGRRQVVVRYDGKVRSAGLEPETAP